MARTYKVIAGSQYDAKGATVISGPSITTYNADATYNTGDLVRDSDEAVVLAAVRRVIASGQREVVTSGESSTPASAETLADYARHERLMAEMDRPESDY